MFKIRTMNTISPLGAQILEKHGCEVGSQVENPDALIIRSADLHSTEFWPELLCIGRAGAGTNNIPSVSPPKADFCFCIAALQAPIIPA